MADIDVRRTISVGLHYTVTLELEEAVKKVLRRHKAAPIKNSDEDFWLKAHVRAIMEDRFVVDEEVCASKEGASD